MPEQSYRKITRIENVFLLADPEDDRVPQATIEIENGRIAYAGPARTRHSFQSKRESVQVLNAEGRTAIPGLIDLHVHLTSDLDSCLGANPPQFTPRQIAKDVLESAATLRGALRQGVTGIRDCGCPHHGVFGLRDWINECGGQAPRLWLSGRALCATGGHAVGIGTEIDGRPSAIRAVRTETKAGADWVKLMVTGGTATPGERPEDVQLNASEMEAVVSEAHRRGRSVSAHCSCLEGVRSAIAAGVDTIEHGIGIDADTAERMREADVALIPTLACSRIEAQAGPESGIPEHTRQKAQRIYHRHRKSLATAHETGVLLGCGTDSGPSYLPIGMASIVAELEAMIDVGIAPGAAFASATKTAAGILGIAEDLGTITVGKLADLVIVDTDPREEIATLLSPAAVLKGGVLVSDSQYAALQSRP